MNVDEPLDLAVARVGEDAFVDWYAANHGGVQRPCRCCQALAWVSAQYVERVASGSLLPICGACAAQEYRDVGVIPIISQATLEGLEDMDAKANERN